MAPAPSVAKWPPLVRMRARRWHSGRLLMFRAFVGVLATLLLSPMALAAPPTITPAPLAELVRAVDIRYSRFVLPNGLTVIVAPDRKAPLVRGVGVVSRRLAIRARRQDRFRPSVRASDVRAARRMCPRFDEPLENVGVSDNNGTTFFDRTNYFETVPTGALDLALFMEADRMGHLLGAVTQTKLDAQRGVVQNEKRENDNEPYGLVDYAQLAALFPPGHPYRHPTIGSMADLDHASLATVHEWFKTHYGPNNAVLVLAGDIDEATARAKAAKWFGAIPRGSSDRRRAGGGFNPAARHHPGDDRSRRRRPALSRLGRAGAERSRRPRRSIWR